MRYYKYLTRHQIHHILGAVNASRPRCHTNEHEENILVLLSLPMDGYIVLTECETPSGCLKQHERMREERKRQCNIQLSDRRKLAGYLPLVETSRSTAWASVQCASPVRAFGDHQQTSKKQSQSCAAPLNWAST